MLTRIRNRWFASHRRPPTFTMNDVTRDPYLDALLAEGRRDMDARVVIMPCLGADNGHRMWDDEGVVYPYDTPHQHPGRPGLFKRREEPS